MHAQPPDFLSLVWGGNVDKDKRLDREEGGLYRSYRYIYMGKKNWGEKEDSYTLEAAFTALSN